MRHRCLPRFAILAAAVLPVLLLAGTAQARVVIVENTPLLEQPPSTSIAEPDGKLPRQIVLPIATTMPMSSVPPVVGYSGSRHAGCGGR